MTEDLKKDITANLKKAKTEGKNRLARIKNIIHDAAYQAVTEVREGSGEIQNITKDTMATMLENITVSDNSEQKETRNVSQTSFLTLIKNLFVALKTKLVANTKDLFISYRNDEWKEKIIDLDNHLSAKYGNRYQSIKEKAGQVATQYKQAVANTEDPEQTAIRQQQLALENQAGKLGTVVAQKEQQIRQKVQQQLQSMLKT